MKIAKKCLAIFYLLIPVNCIQPTPKTGTPEKPVIIAYYANFEGKRPVKNLTFKGLDYIIHSFIYPDKNDKIDSSAIDQDIVELIDSARSNKVNVMVSLGPDHDSKPRYQAIAKDTNRIKEFAIQVAKFCIRHKYAGLDLDWEKPEKEDTDNYLNFVRIFNRELKKETLLFSITLPGQFSKTDYLNYKELAKHVDWINLMTYDFGNVDTQKCMHNTPLADIQKEIALFLAAHIPAAKLVHGMAFYGRKYNKVESFHIGAKGLREKKLYPVDSILPKLNDSHWEKEFDSIQQVPFMYNRKLQQFISYDDSISLLKKCKYVKDTKLKGIMFWAIDYDAKEFPNSFQKIVGDNFIKTKEK
jgi:chitinase